jgi:hypothetical protein
MQRRPGTVRRYADGTGVPGEFNNSTREPLGSDPQNRPLGKSPKAEWLRDFPRPAGAQWLKPAPQRNAGSPLANGAATAFGSELYRNPGPTIGSEDAPAKERNNAEPPVRGQISFGKGLTPKADWEETFPTRAGALWYRPAPAAPPTAGPDAAEKIDHREADGNVDLNQIARAMPWLFGLPFGAEFPSMPVRPESAPAGAKRVPPAPEEDTQRPATQKAIVENPRARVLNSKAHFNQGVQ